MQVSRQKEIKNYILGKRYDLSVAFLSSPEMRRVSRKTKKKNKASNVLAFPLTKTSGEILLCPDTARREAPQYEMTVSTFRTFLFIHACLHLRGYTHGATMEREERRILRRFGFDTHEQHRHRHRRRHLPSQSRHRRAAG